MGIFGIAFIHLLIFRSDYKSMNQYLLVESEWEDLFRDFIRLTLILRNLAYLTPLVKCSVGERIFPLRGLVIKILAWRSLRLLNGSTANDTLTLLQ